MWFLPIAEGQIKMRDVETFFQRPIKNLFETLKELKDVRIVVSPPLSMGIFAYPSREGGKTDPRISSWDIRWR